MLFHSKVPIVAAGIILVMFADDCFKLTVPECLLIFSILVENCPDIYFMEDSISIF